MNAPAKHLAGLTLPPELLDHLADLIADRVAERLGVGAEPWLSVEQAAAHLACPQSRIYDLVAQGRVEHARDGRRLVFRREALDASLATARPRRVGVE